MENKKTITTTNATITEVDMKTIRPEDDDIFKSRLKEILPERKKAAKEASLEAGWYVDGYNNAIYDIKKRAGIK